MPTIGEILSGVGQGAAKGLGVALTPVAMAMAARGGRNPMSAIPGYNEPLDAIQQARLQALQSQNDYQRAMLGLIGSGGFGNGQAQPSGVAAPQGGAPYFLAAPGAEVSPATMPQQQPQGLSGMLGGMANDLASTPRTQQPQIQQPGGGVVRGGGPGTVNIGGRPYIPVPQFGARGPSIGLQPEPAPIRLPAGATAVDAEGNPVTSVAGRQVLKTVPGETAATRTRSALFASALKQMDVVERNLKQLGEFGTWGARLRSAKTGFGLSDPKWKEYQAGADLLATALMNAHVGARGSQGIMDHFVKELFGANIQSSDNMEASIKAAREYLERVTSKKEDPDTVAVDILGRVGAAESPNTSAGQPAQPAVPAAVQSNRQKFDAIFSPQTASRALGGSLAPKQLSLVGENGPELMQSSGPSMITPLAQVQSEQVNRIAKAQGAGMPMQLAALGAKSTGQVASPTPTTTIPSQGFGQGVGARPEDVQKAQQQQGTWTQDAHGNPVYLTPAQQ